MVLLITLGIVLVLVIYADLSILIYSLRNGIAPMPTSPKVKAALLNTLGELSVQGNYYELGSGWGTLTFPMAKRFPNSTILGIENSRVPYTISKCLSWVFPKRNLKLCRADFFTVSLAESDLVICYLYRGAMERLRGKFERELRPGTIVVSNTFSVPNWEPKQVLQATDLYRSKIYVYQVS